MSKIYDNLYLGSYADARNQNFLNRCGITHIVTVGAELKTLYPRNYKYLYVAALDAPSYRLLNHFDTIADFIHNAIENENGKVFVHCFAGISRSTSSIIAYMIKHRGMNFHESRAYIRSKRSIICPNPGFVTQLNTYQRNFLPKNEKPESKIVASSLAGSTLSNFTSSQVSQRDSLEGVSKSQIGLSNSQMGLTVSRVWGTTSNISPNTTFTQKFGATKMGGFNSNKNANMMIKGSDMRKNEENVQPSLNKFDYFCRSCGIKLFDSDCIVHNTGRTFNAHCNAIYVRTETLNLNTSKLSFAKISCPNLKCNNTLGFTNLKGGKCGCNKEIGNVWGIYPLKVTYAKLKALNI